MNGSYNGKKVLITGGTGSFGHTVTKQILDTDVAEVRILSRDEAKQDAMRHQLNDSRVRFYVGDVRDYLSVERATKDIDYMFHAAALKQVPSCEFFPMEAVRTNINGSANVVRAAEFNHVETLVCLSTDKAVYPVNAMGVSKAMMEKIAQSHGLNNPNTGTTVTCVRYGNVMYSRGSVIPLFIRQIKEGKKVTVTNPDMTRFLMSLQDSVSLVDFAFRHAEQGDLFVKKAASSTVGDLARAVCRLFGVPEELDIIGTRHAEKLSEALASREELSRAVDMGEFFKVAADTRDLNYAPFVEQGDKSAEDHTAYDSHTVDRLNVKEIEDLLLTLPEVREELHLFGRTERLGASQ